MDCPRKDGGWLTWDTYQGYKCSKCGQTFYFDKYVCPKCHHSFEEQSFQYVPITCPKCGYAQKGFTFSSRKDGGVSYSTNYSRKNWEPQKFSFGAILWRVIVGAIPILGLIATIPAEEHKHNESANVGRVLACAEQFAWLVFLINHC
jgi:DNA-directed RNA polymerase subunit RPC12/RpoP